MSGSVQISITFLEEINARLREMADEKSAIVPSVSASTFRSTAWLLPLMNSVMAVSLILMVAGVLGTWR